MKTFTCREMGGPCDVAFEGETMNDVIGMGGKHIMSTTDATHEPIRDQMKNGTKEGKDKWFAWFKTEWDKKA